MKFRPCIDLHHGKVKQIVGSTLKDDNNNNKSSSTSSSSDAQPQQEPPPSSSSLAENFSTDKPASEFAQMYSKDGLTGGHVIMLGPGNAEAARSALEAYPNGLQVGGGINDTNAQEWLNYGASHVIVTSHVFKNGVINYDRLNRLVEIVGGKERLVLDLSCRRKTLDGPYYVVTDRWQTFTDCPVNADTLKHLAQYCDEFLVHGVEVEGKQCGILEDLVGLLGEHSPLPVTYAGGVRSLEDMELVKRLGKGKVDCTIGSALDCFGGPLSYDEVVAWHHKEEEEESKAEAQR